MDPAVRETQEDFANFSLTPHTCAAGPVGTAGQRLVLAVLAVLHTIAHPGHRDARPAALALGRGQVGVESQCSDLGIAKFVTSNLSNKSYLKLRLRAPFRFVAPSFILAVGAICSTVTPEKQRELFFPAS